MKYHCTSRNWPGNFKNISAIEKVSLVTGSVIKKKEQEEYKTERDDGDGVMAFSDSDSENDSVNLGQPLDALRKLVRDDKLKQRGLDARSSTKFRREQIPGRYVLHQLLMHGRMWEKQPIWGSENGEVIVVDPFCGAGTSMMQAQRLGMHSIGIDIDPMAQTLYHGTSTTNPAKGGTYERMLKAPQFEWVSTSPYTTYTPRHATHHDMFAIVKVLCH